MQGIMRSWIPALVAGTAVVLTTSALAMGLSAAGWEASLASYSISAAIIGMAMALIGALVLREARGNVIGVLLSAAGLWATFGAMCSALSAVLADGSSLRWVLIFVQGVWPPTVFLFLLVPQLYPDGHVMSRRWRIPFVAAVIASIVSSVALITSQHVFDGYPDAPANPLAVAIPEGVLGAVAAVGALIVVGTTLAAVVGHMLRLRRLHGADRARIAWLVSAVVLMIAAFVGTSPTVALVIELASLACLGIGIVRYQLFDIEEVFTRGLVFIAVVLAALVAALVTATLLGTRSDVGIGPLLAATVTAVVLAFAFRRLTARVDRLMFGRRNDPISAVTLLGERLAAAVQPEDALPVIVITLRESLRLPYSAVFLEGEETPAAESGERSVRVVEFPLQYAGRTVGLLQLGIRRGERDLAPPDRRLVLTFASQAGTAAQSAQVARALRRSREGLVLAREEERRLLRRELHDGVGPALAGISLGLQSLTRSLADDRQRQLSADLLEQAQRSLEELRTVARELRPAALDELGLVAAVRQHAALASRLTGGQPSVFVEAPEELPSLNAAVEVAAFRIVQEGLSNAIQHAEASRCDVALAVGESLVVTLRDDGSGRRPDEAGAGLRSMRERAEELGGQCVVTFVPGTGTCVRAVLPLMIAGAAGGRA
jgi:signal transduction histidine kinase